MLIKSYIWKKSTFFTKNEFIFGFNDLNVFIYQIDTIKHIVVYDDLTKNDSVESSALECANQYSKFGSFNKVMILEGGYQEYTQKYSFMRSTEVFFGLRQLYSNFKVDFFV